jgi:ribosome-binding factor A
VRILNRKRREIQQAMSANVILKYTPHLQFTADASLTEASRVLDILDHLPPYAAPEEEEAEDAPPES